MLAGAKVILEKIFFLTRGNIKRIISYVNIIFITKSETKSFTKKITLYNGITNRVSLFIPPRWSDSPPAPFPIGFDWPENPGPDSPAQWQ